MAELPLVQGTDITIQELNCLLPYTESTTIRARVANKG